MLKRYARAHLVILKAKNGFNHPFEFDKNGRVKVEHEIIEDKDGTTREVQVDFAGCVVGTRFTAKQIQSRIKERLDRKMT